MNKRRWIAGVAAVAVLVIAVVAALWWSSGSSSKQAALERVVINEAVRTLLYLPLYHAAEQGYFRDAGLDVQIVTGGNATNSFAAMLSGEAQFSQADPMYVPISREKGSQTKVVAQVVGRIAVWGLTMDPAVKDWTVETVRGKKISTHVRPMTAFTYAEKAVRDIGLDPDKDVEIIQSNPGAELVPLLNGQADFAFTLEPSVSTAIGQGAHIVFSFPAQLGDQVFTALMTTDEYLRDNRATVVAVVRGYQRALNDIRTDPAGSLKSARAFFPQLKDQVIHSAVERMIAERVIPQSVELTDESWARAVRVRVDAGDLRSGISLEDGCDLSVMQAGARP